MVVEDQLPYYSDGNYPIPLPTPPSIINSADNEVDYVALALADDKLLAPFGDLRDEDAEAGVCGLKNLGNTCFLSTGLQCLMATPALVHCLLNPLVPVPLEDTLASDLAQLTHKIWSGNYSSILPTDFKCTLGTHYPQFKDYRQHDCQEFLALLLDALHEQLNTSMLRNKLQDMRDTDCDSEQKSKLSLTSVQNCKSASERIQKNIEDTKDILKLNLSCKNKVSSFNVGKKVNNIEISETAATADNINYKNECEEEESLVKNHDATTSSKKNGGTLLTGMLNNCSPQLNCLQNIIKDTKTSNVNVLATEQETNNEIKFDSDKFPRSEKVRQRENFSYNSFHLFDNNVSSGKRGKSTVTHYKTSVDFREGLDLKRLKMQRNDHEDCDSESIMEVDWDKNHRMEDERKHRVSNKSLDKNYRMECERRRREGPGPSTVASEAEGASVKMDEEADLHWHKHLAAHQSVIVDTFQGQFKSTVVCSKCNHVSVTYEPFMYLSVPLPNAMEYHLIVTFVSPAEHEPTQFHIVVNKGATVRSIKDQLLELIEPAVSFIVIAEVLDHHIAKILDDNHSARFINYTSRNLYAFDLAKFPEILGDNSLENDAKIGCKSFDETEGNACTICLDEKDAEMSRHVGCVCILCDSCVTRTTQHYGEGLLQCPVCHLPLVPGDNLIPVGAALNIKPPVRMMNVPLVFRFVTVGGNNNTKKVRLFGHPQLLSIPNRLHGQHLHEAVALLVPYSQPFKLLLVNGRGHNCSRCMYYAHCCGCPIDVNDCIVLKTGDCLAATFVEPVPEISAKQHSSMLNSTANTSLSLYDCIQAFSKSEVLDEHNPWFCPNCKQNQCATKTLSVWRYPNYLIIYLKRFVFQDCISTKIEDKVTFPLCGLNMSSDRSLYDLYACVCHVGGVSAGHYTAYTQHPRTGEWHHYNDDHVTKRLPQEEDYSNAYILFYKKRGADMKNEDFNAKLVSINRENIS